MRISRFVLATQNKGKTAEFYLFLSDALPGYPLLGLDTLSEDIPVPQETGSSFEENARIKALHYNQFCDEDCCIIAEDSGLMVDGLGGAPGVHSARYAGEPADDQRNIDKLLSALQQVEDRTARFITVIALANRGRVITTFSGEVQGQIALHRRGKGGFGYDPVFYYPPLNRSFAELSSTEKNQVSHRAKAMFALKHFLLCMNRSART